jgi:hypothetical protein
MAHIYTTTYTSIVNNAWLLALVKENYPSNPHLYYEGPWF